jgi:hypothetical protein
VRDGRPDRGGGGWSRPGIPNEEERVSPRGRRIDGLRNRIEEEVMEKVFEIYIKTTRSASGTRSPTRR